jgi:drug/metabolite transporter (DMT)-like permease
VLVWSANFVVVKAGIGVLGPLTFTTTRYAVAAITLLLLSRWRFGAIRRPGRFTLPLIGLGMLGFGGYQVLWTLGLTQITAGDSALIIAASPVVTALVAGAVGLDRLTGPKLAGALTAFAGVAIVIGAGAGLALGASLVGDLLTLTAALLWATYTVLGTRVLRHVDPLTATTWTVLGGLVFLLPFRRPPSPASSTRARWRRASRTSWCSTRSSSSGPRGRLRCSCSCLRARWRWARSS